MSPFIFCGIIAAIGWSSFAVAEENSFATSDAIRIKSVEWKNNTVGTTYLIEYETSEKPQIIWGSLDYHASPIALFLLTVPFPENQENWINTFRKPNGILILHIPQKYTLESQYLFVSFSIASLTLEIQIDRIWCAKRGQKGKQFTPDSGVTIKPFGNTNEEMKNVQIRMESKRSFHEMVGVYSTVNNGHNIPSTAIHPKHYDSAREGDIYVGYINVKEIPLNSILTIRYKTYGTFRHDVISTYRYQHRMLIKNSNSREEAVSLLTGDTKPKIPLTTTALIKCVAIGFPRPSITFSKGSKLLEPSSKYDVTFDYVTVSYLEIPDFSLADIGTYRCVAQSGSSRNYIDFEVTHDVYVSKDKTKVTTLTKDKVEVVCLANGYENFEVWFIIQHGKEDSVFKTSGNKTITIGNVTSDVIISLTSISTIQKSAHLVILNPNMQELSSIKCAAKDSSSYDSHTVLKMRELREVSAWFSYYMSSHMKTALCTTSIRGFEGDDLPDIITMEWYKNEVKPENKIKADANTVIVTQNNNQFDSPESYLLLLDKGSREPLDYEVVCRAYTRFKEYSTVAKT